MESIKRAFHIRSKSKNNANVQPTAEEADARASIDSEVARMTPAERDQYIKDMEEAESTGTPKKGSFLDKLINAGNKKTEEQLTREAQEREASNLAIR